MGSVARRRALLVLTVGVVLLASAWLTASASAYVFWGFSAPSLDQSGIGRAGQDGSGASARTVPVSSNDLLKDSALGQSAFSREFGNDAGVAISGAHVYWGWYGPTIDQSGIGRATLGGSHVSGQLISVPGSDQLQGLAIAGNYVYWGWDAPTRDAAGIGRAELNGSHVDDNFVSLPSSDDLEGLAANGSYLYWGWKAPTRDATGIGRAKLSGSHVDNGFVSLSSRDEPAGVAVNGSYIYWGWNGPSIDESGIGRAKLNGTDVKGQFISVSGRDQIGGTAIDGSYIYWAWYGPSLDQSGIGGAKLDGSNVKGRYISVSGRDQIGGIAVGGPPATIASVPTISGTAKQGDKLTEHHASWLNGVSSYPDRWERCNSSGGGCTKISGATHSTYTLSAGDVGHTIRVQETAVNASGDGKTVTSAHTSKVLPLPPTNLTPPSISANVSAAFTAGLGVVEVHGTWTGSPTNYSYQWELCNASGAGCNAIPDATGQTYTLSSADYNNTIRVQEIAKNSGGSSTPATSTQSPLVVPPAPVNVTAPSIAGDLYVGQTLSEVPASWTYGPTSFKYQWLLCNAIREGCGPIAGATGSTYTIPDGDSDNTLAVEETATNAGGTSSTVVSAITATIGSFNEARGAFAPTTDLAPVVTGVGMVGQTLEASSGAWQGTPTLAYDYEWQLCSSANSCSIVTNTPTDATSTTFTLTSADAGMSVRVVVGATNSASGAGFNGVASNMVAVSS
jgi:hypothetical protein